MKFAAALVAVLVPLAAQEIKMPPGLDRLAAKAEESVDITLDGAMLRMAARFLSDHDPEEARARKTISGLQSITVRSFGFSSDGQYDPADVAAIRAQLQPPAWSRMIGVKSRSTGEDVDIFFKAEAGGQLGGVFLICAGPRELTVVSLVGTIDPEHLADLGGQFHIPALDFELHGFRRAK